MMNRPNPMYKKGGLNDEGGEIDEVSGNKVPVGGTKKGVRDDIEVNMSAGEWVADEATTRYHGLKTFLGMRDEAMMGMKKMEAMGLMGNSDEATLPTDMPFGMADLIVVEVDEKNGKEKEINMQEGGVLLNQTGETISLEGQQQDTPVRPNVEVTFDQVMAESKMEFKEYRNAEGQSLMVPFIGGVPLYPIPEGYTLYTGEGSEIGETDLPTTGAEEITPSAQDDDDGDKERALAAYRGSQQDTTIQWDTLSDDDFLKEANNRNGFGRNLAMGIASMISPFAAVGMAGLMAMEDKKVLAMARARLANLPTGSAQRAAYEKMIKGYEARGKGLFGGIISKVVDILGNVLGTSEEAKTKAQNANLVANSGLVVGRYSSNGQITAEGTEAVNTGVVEGFNNITGTDTITTDQYQQLLKDKDSTDETVSTNAKVKLSNYIGDELGSYVNPMLMDTVREGFGDLSPEQTRLAFVNIAYQPSTVLKDQLDALTPSQQKFLGYTEGADPATVLAQRQNAFDVIQGPNAGLMEVQGAFQDIANLPTAASGTLSNYLDISDEMREQVSQILPMDTPRLPPKDGAKIGMLDTSDSTRTSVGRDTSDIIPTTVETTPTSTVDFLQTQRDNQVRALIDAGVPASEADKTVPAVSTSFTTPEQTGLEAMEATYDPYNVGQLGEFAGMGEADTQTNEAFDIGPAVSRDQFGQTVLQPEYTGEAYKYPTEEPKTVSSFSAAQQEQDIGDYAQQVFAQTGNLVVKDLEAAGYTGTEIESFLSDPNKPREEQQIQTGVGTVGFNQQTAEANQRILEQAKQAETKPTVDYSTLDRNVEEDTNLFPVSIRDPEEDEGLFPTTKTTTPTLADIVPDSGGISTPAAADTMSFDDAFAAARAAEKKQGIASGTGQFEYNGQMYSTATAEEAAAATTVSKQTEQKGKYNVTANKQLSGGYDTSTLSDAEQTAFDAAVDRGDASVADHFASVNRHRNKQDEYAASGFDKTVGRSLGLNEDSMAQAEKYGGSVQTAINEGRAESGGFLKPAVVTDDSKSKGGSGAGTTTTTSKKDDKPSSTSSSKSTIKSGDTLSQIAKDNGTTVNELMKANPNIKDANKIQAGASINIPKKSSGGGGSSNNDKGGSGAAKSDSGGCCFIMLEARYGDGTMDEVVRRYRDEHMTDRNRRGYYKVAEVFVPLMRKSKVFKWVVTKTFADPLVSYGKYYYGQNKHGVIYSPVKSLWMKVFDIVGGDTEFIRENGEVV